MYSLNYKVSLYYFVDFIIGTDLFMSFWRWHLVCDCLRSFNFRFSADLISIIMSTDEQSTRPCAWVTLATNDNYALGALVLANSLRRAATTKQLHCMITPGVSQGMRLVCAYFARSMQLVMHF
jgi:hypothetical protein